MKSLQADGRTDDEQLTITKGSLKLSVQVRWTNKPNQTNSWLSPSYFIKDEPKRTIHTRYMYIMGKLISGITIQYITNKSEISAIFLAFFLILIFDLAWKWQNYQKLKFAASRGGILRSIFLSCQTNAIVKPQLIVNMIIPLLTYITDKKI